MVEWIAIGDALAGLAQKIYNAVHSVASGRSASRSKLADLLDKIAKDIRLVSAAVRRGEAPNESCAALQEYADKLPEVVGSLYDPNTVTEFASMLRAVYIDKVRLAEMTDDQRQHFPGKVDQAAGRLEAAANLLRAM